MVYLEIDDRYYDTYKQKHPTDTLLTYVSKLQWKPTLQKNIWKIERNNYQISNNLSQTSTKTENKFFSVFP